MSCSTNRRKKLLHTGLAPVTARHLGITSVQAGEFLEKVFDQSEYPAEIDPPAMEKYKQAAELYCEHFFSAAAASGYPLGHKGTQPSVKHTLGYANLWRTMSAFDNDTPLPPLAAKIASADYGVNRCEVCGRYYTGSEGCQNDHSGLDRVSEPTRNNTNKAEAKPAVRVATQVPIPPQPAKSEKLPVFVYGTLRTGMGNWDRLLKGKTSAEVPATLPGSKMYSTGLAWVMDATETEPPLQVQGDLMFLDQTEYRQVMTRLDGLEGYNPKTDEGMYRRVARMVKYTDETGLEQETLSWVYYAGDADRPGRYLQRDLVEDGDWLRHTGREEVRPDPVLKQKRYYFAFGSNMNDTRMTKRGVKFARKMHGTLTGFRLNFNKKSGMPGIGYANIEAGDGVVEGVMYETTEEGLRSLDKYEGVQAGHYRRETVKVRTPDGEEIEAVVYVAEPHMTQEGLKPSREYLDHLLAGKDHLSPEYYRELSQVKAAPNPPPPKSYSNYAGSGSYSGSSGKGSGSYYSGSGSSGSGYNQTSMFQDSPTAAQQKAKKDLETTLNVLDLNLTEEQKLFRLAKQYGMSVPELLRHFLKEKLGEQ